MKWINKIIGTLFGYNKKISTNSQKNITNFDYILSKEEGIVEFNKLQIGKEYDLLNHVTGKYVKQTYQPPNEQETFEKLMHWIRYGWIILN